MDAMVAGLPTGDAEMDFCPTIRGIREKLTGSITAPTKWRIPLGLSVAR